MKNLKELRTIMLSEKQIGAPLTRTYGNLKASTMSVPAVQPFTKRTFKNCFLTSTAQQVY